MSLSSLYSRCMLLTHVLSKDGSRRIVRILISTVPASTENALAWTEGRMYMSLRGLDHVA